MKLDLGSGRKPMDGFVGVDVVPGVADICVDLASGEPWPFADDSVEELWSSHFIEHILAENVPVWTPVRKVSESDAAWSPFVDGYMRAGGCLWQRTTFRRDALFHFFSEAYRVAKPGARFTVIWPCVTSRMAFRDPTHRRFLDVEFAHYLSREGRRIYDVEHYGLTCNWVGTASDIIRETALEGRNVDEVREQSRREWNVADESMVQLVAEKGDV